jgi:hypothetical protein
MPNHYTVIGIFGQQDNCDEIDFSSLSGVDLCALVSPVPRELTYAVCSTTPHMRYDDDTQRGLAELAEFKRKYGHSNALEWQKANWGTKWGTYRTKVHQLQGDGSPIMIEFVCAWNPPSPEMLRKIESYLYKTYKLQSGTWIGHEPYDNTTKVLESQTTH